MKKEYQKVDGGKRLLEETTVVKQNYFTLDYIEAGILKATETLDYWKGLKTKFSE